MAPGMIYGWSKLINFDGIFFEKKAACKSTDKRKGKIVITKVS